MQARILHRDGISLVTVRNEVAKVMFLHLSVSHSVHRGEYLGRYPPGPGTPPLPWARYTTTPRPVTTPGRYTPWQVHSPRPGTPPQASTPPGTRYTPAGTPLQQVHPPTPRTTYTPRQVHPWQVHSPRPGTPPRQVQLLAPGTPQQVHPPPRTRYTPWQVHPLDQVHPPTGTPPGSGTLPNRYTPGTRYTPSRRLLLRTVRILLECILVDISFCKIVNKQGSGQYGKSTILSKSFAYV